MTLIETSTGELAKRIIIEGPDCVGKDTFIARLQDYIKGVDRFKGANMQVVVQEGFTPHGGERLIGVAMETFIGDLLRSHRDELSTIVDETEYHSAQTEVLNRYGTLDSIEKTVPKYANMISTISIHSKDGSPESAEFIRKLDQGEITDQEAIAEEYLQVHYDLERLAQRLDETYSAVIMNRSLISFYAMQLHAMGFEHLREKWRKLWSFADQSEALYIRLTAPEAIVRERLAARQGSDFRGEVENFYMSKWQAIEQGFIKAQNNRLCRYSITVDTSQPDEVIDGIIESIALGIVKREINDSVLRDLLKR